MTSALSPAVIAAVEDLELAARLIVEGLRTGGHRSPLHGFSAEFQQHRAYRAGDDLKYLDWKLLARTDRLHTRTFRETTSMSVMLVVDSSASMAYPALSDAERGDDAIPKFRYATIIAAALAYLISTQGDAVGLWSSAADGSVYAPPRGGRLHLRALIAQLDALRPHGRWDGADALTRAAERLTRPGNVIVVSDFYDRSDAVLHAARRARRMGHDVTLMHVLSPAELDFPFDGDVEFEDLESGEQRRADASALAEQYRRAMGTFVAQVRDGALHDGVDHVLMRTDVSPERALREYLLQRAAGADAVETRRG